MKVKLLSSWTDPIIGRILPKGEVIEIDAKFFNADYHEEQKKETTKSK